MLYTIGYSGLKLDDLHRYLERHNLALLDIRMSARARMPAWNKSNLIRTLGARYHHVPELGNVNYKNDGPIQINDLDAGEAIVREFLSRYEGAVLMCACKDLHTCHRHTVSETLSESMEIPVTHLTSGSVSDLPSFIQQLLF